MKFIYRFGGGRADGNADMKNVLGGKGANLAEMATIGLPVPPGFTITSELCIAYLKKGRYPKGYSDEVDKGIMHIEELTGRKLGDTSNPLLVSVRSGARISMPGMMDTILNLGITDKTVDGLIRQTNDERFAYDSYRRFIMMFSNVVQGIPRVLFEKPLREVKERERARFDYQVSVEGLKELIKIYKKIYLEKIGEHFPNTPKKQLKMAIDAVFKSWNNERAIEYRRIYDIPEDWGTAVNIQAMVFGNMGDDSATGVAFTRNPNTGAKKPYGEYLINAQGEDVVAGVRTPKSLTKMENDKTFKHIFEELTRIFKKLEQHYKDMQDVEFTVEKSRLWILQTRTGKRTAVAAVKIASDMVKEELITREEAILRIKPDDIDNLLHPMIDPDVDKKKLDPIAKGIAAAPGAAVGKVVITAEDAVRLSDKGQKVILIREETSADDIAGMARAEGFLTVTGGKTSHAAVVARGMGKPCVVGCDDLYIDMERREIRVGHSIVIKEGDIITIDGTSGYVYQKEIKLITPKLNTNAKRILRWADEIRKKGKLFGVRANADQPEDAAIALEYGAEGIGLCRTEHMFFNPERIDVMREMILAESKEQREAALSELLPMQKNDFRRLFEVMIDKPIIIRTLDPPLHEFLPSLDDEESIKEIAKKLKVFPEQLKERIKKLHENNPMLGHRGVRLGITYPEITKMQVRAIFEAACEMTKESKHVLPNIMIPLVGHFKEFVEQRKIVDEVANDVFKRYQVKVSYKVGTMIELPRAALTADQIAKHADFFSFGTNDLTQTTFGFSRDDVAKFIPMYIEKKILKYDPFQTIDVDGVGQLIIMAVEKGRSINSKLSTGICGEHGGDPLSIEFAYQAKVNYVSCSPYRIPVARLVGAQAIIKHGDIKKRSRKK